MYAFDSTTIELCLNAFKWAIYRKNQGKGGIKVHTLYDIETSIPTFLHITEARVNDMNAMDAIPYEENKRKFIFFTSAFAEDEMLQMASVSLTETLPLDKLFSKPNYNIVNELDESSEPTLF